LWSETQRRRALVIAALAIALTWLGLPEYRDRGPSGPPLEWRHDLDLALTEATAYGVPAILSFDADWCSVCERLDRNTLQDPAVASELDRFVRVRIDASRRTPETDALLHEYGALALPALIFVSGNGEVLPSPRVLGFVEPDHLLPLLQSVH
jgi:thiol:disulfide interchange protein